MYPPWIYLESCSQNKGSLEDQTEINLLNVPMGLILWVNKNKTNGL